MANSEDPKSNKGNLTFLTTQYINNVIELNCKVIKKVATPHFYINPSPFSGLSPISTKKFCTLPMGRGGGGGGPTMTTNPFY